MIINCNVPGFDHVSIELGLYQKFDHLKVKVYTIFSDGQTICLIHRSEALQRAGVNKSHKITWSYSGDITVASRKMSAVNNKQRDVHDLMMDILEAGCLLEMKKIASRNSK
ncbi:uncharacterized protein LOC132747133 [Ruditapes philippinarum]|uniref:uncharacterized protein LOC132747133 n=1 Tax=Ruditapes philippinarum TaxID=129788 RepID=UPI00295A7C50|nr:uncharacterized protein LOC132747133 [Ruditapes philippinarum]